jgi:xylulokinase
LKRRKMVGELFLAMDVGTSSVKSAAIDAQGKTIAETTCTYPTHRPQPGWAEQDPRDWTRSLTHALKALCTKLGGEQQDIIGCALSGHGPTLVLIDSQGEPLVPAPTWQDYRSLAQGDVLLREADSRDWLGMGPLRTGMAAKLLWAKQNWSEAFENCRWVMGVKEYIHFWLTGEVASEPSSGPGAMEWPQVVFEYIGLPLQKLPEVYPITYRIGGIRSEVARETGLPAGLPVYMGLNDGASSTLGAGACDPGHACISLGTNGVGRLVLDRPFSPEVGLEIDAFFWPFVPERWIVGGMTITGGSCLDWIRGCAGAPEFAVITQEAEQVPLGSRGIIFLPYLMGRGTPYPQENARAAFLNLDISHGRGEMTRAVMEGVGFALREIYTEFQARGFNLGDIRITGGGARLALWRQIMAGILNRRMIHAGGDATLGAAIVVATASGYYRDIPLAVQAMVHTRHVEDPNPEHVAQYQVAFKAYIDLAFKLGFRQVPVERGGKL